MLQRTLSGMRSTIKSVPKCAWMKKYLPRYDPIKIYITKLTKTKYYKCVHMLYNNGFTRVLCAYSTVYYTKFVCVGGFGLQGGGGGVKK